MPRYCLSRTAKSRFKESINNLWKFLKEALLIITGITLLGLIAFILIWIIAFGIQVIALFVFDTWLFHIEKPVIFLLFLTAICLVAIIGLLSWGIIGPILSFLKNVFWNIFDKSKADYLLFEEC